MKSIRVHLLSLLCLGLTLAAVPLSGCRNAHTDRRLDRAEQLMEQWPDSAFALLDSIDISDLRGERHARYALLLSQAYNKRGIDLTDDSLISIAVKYYQHTSNTYYKMLAHQYHACVYLNANNYPSALNSALLAHDEATELDDAHNLSRIESVLGIIYSICLDFQEAERWDKMALANAKRVNNSKWIELSYERIAAALMSMGQCNEALQYADSVVAIAGYTSPSVFDIKYRSYFGLKQDDKADSVMQVMRDLGIAPTETANRVIDHLRPRSLEEVIEQQNDAIRELNEYVIEIFQNSMSASLNQYLDDKSRRLNAEIEHKRTQTIIVISFGILITVLLSLLLMLLRLRAKNQLIKSENALHMLSADCERLRHKVKEVTDQGYEALSQQASVAFMQRFSWVEKVGDIYLNANLKAGKDVKTLHKNVAHELQRTLNMSFDAEFERMCKQHKPELWNEICALHLKPAERELLLLILSGVSTRVISLVTGKSNTAIYTMKSRIKRELQQLETPLAQHLLTVL